MASQYRLNIDELITVDASGMPKPASTRQLMDKDIRELYARDKSKDKSKFIGEVGLIYQLGDPNSIFKQEGLTDKEIIKKSIEFYGLPRMYKPDDLVLRIAKRYYKQRITPAGVAIEALQKALQNEVTLINRINDIFAEKLKGQLTIEEVEDITGLMKTLNAEAKNIPELTKSINEAYENLIYEREAKSARGGGSILSSMTEQDI